ncbi:MAG: hypothetical protein JWO53_571 [Chlamydiia bacterium]|nr:hypothetical protein [Chlamydiia bacterium]
MDLRDPSPLFSAMRLKCDTSTDEKSDTDLLAAVNDALKQNQPLSSRVQNILQNDPANRYKEFLQTITIPSLSDRQIKVLIKNMEELTSWNVIALKYSHLLNHQLETTDLTQQRALKTAFYIQSQFNKEQALNRQQFVLTPKKTKLPQTLQYNHEQDTLYVCARSKHSYFKSNGTFKSITAAAAIALNDPIKLPEPVIRAITKRDSCRESLRLAQHEIEIYRELRGAPGILQLRTAHKFVSQGGLERISMIFDKCDGDLSIDWENPRLFSFDQKLSIMKGLLQGLHSCHSRGIIHGDLKLANMLYKQTNSTTQAVLADFGYAFNPKKGEKAHHLYEKGLYGFIWATSPEVYGNQFVDKSPHGYKLTEIWAMGFCLYALFYNKYPEWHTIPHQRYKVVTAIKNDNEPAEKQAQSKESFVKEQEDFKNLVMQIIEKDPILIPKQGESYLTGANLIKKCIYSMLRLNPDDRISIEEALKVTETLMTPFEEESPKNDKNSEEEKKSR